MPDKSRIFPRQNLYKSIKRQEARPQLTLCRDLVIAKKMDLCYNM